MKTFFSKALLVCFGVLLCFIILETGLRTAGFMLTTWQSWRNAWQLREKSDIRILCLGESTTHGQYPRYLEKLLNLNRAGIRFSVIDEGVPGTNTSVIVSLMEQKIDQYKPDLVVTMMGVNDRGAHLPAPEEEGRGIARCLGSLKVYKLFRWIEMHVAAKAREVLMRGELPKEKRSGRENDFKKELEAREKALKEKIQREPGDDKTYVDLGLVYKDKEKIPEAEQFFKKAIEINPSNDVAYADLGWLYSAHDRMAESQEAFKRATEINPHNAKVWDILAAVYQSRRLYPQAEAAFRKAIEADPRLDAGYANLGLFLLKRGNFDQAEVFLKKAAEMAPEKNNAYARLAILYCETGNEALCREYSSKVKDASGDIYGPMTRLNYKKAKKILSARNIGWVCVQYPTLQVGSLKEVVGSGEDIAFVDNEESFKSAVRREGHLRYFMDTMGGSWGHCTDAGNELLAGNIAGSIKELLHVRER